MYAAQIDHRTYQHKDGTAQTLPEAWRMIVGCGNAGIRRVGADGSLGPLIFRRGLGSGAINYEQVRHNGRWLDFASARYRKPFTLRAWIHRQWLLTGGVADNNETRAA